MGTRTTKSKRIAAAGGAFVALLLALVSAPKPVLAADMQRMALAPGCYVISAGGVEDVSAYCLDRSRAAPDEGAVLSSISTSLDDAAVRTAGEKPVTLSQAVAEHIVRISGLGSDRRLEIRNLGNRAVEICIDGPTVVMGNGETYTADLDAMRGRLAHLMAPEKGRANGAARAPVASADREHDAIQEKLWNAVKAIHQRQTMEAIQHGVFGPLFPTHATRKPPAITANRIKCVGGTDDAKLCVE